MKRLLRVLDRAALACAGVAAVALSLADLFGLLDLPAFSENLTKIVLLVSGLTLALVATTLTSSTHGIQERLAQVLHRQTEADRDAVALHREALAALAAARTELDGQLRAHRAVAARAVVDQLPLLLHEVEPALLDIYRPYLEEVFRTPARVLTQQRFRIESVDQQRSFHRRAFERHPGGHFVATSLPSRRYFWQSDYVERAMAAFIAGGGVMERVFFLPEGAATLADPECRAVMDAQVEMGVRVSVLEAGRAPVNTHRFLFAEAAGAFAWEALRGPDDQITSFEVTANPADTRRFLELFDQVRSMASPYRPGLAAARQIGGSGTVAVSREPKEFTEFEYRGWQHAAGVYAELWAPMTRQVDDSVLDVLDLAAGEDFLDVACGPGDLTADAVRRGARAVGLDFSPAVLEVARHRHPTLELRRANAQRLPFDDERFDAVAMNFGLPHVADAEAVLGEVARVLRPGGRFAFTVYPQPAEAVAFEWVLRAIADHGEHSTVPHGPDFFHFSTAAECRMALTTAGFAAPIVVQLDLDWRLGAPAELFRAFEEGTARIGGLLRQQGPEARRRIREQVDAAAAALAPDGGELTVPMAAVLASGVKH